MELAPDRYRYILNGPSSRSRASAGSTAAARPHSSARIVKRGTGRNRCTSMAPGAIRSGRSRATEWVDPQGPLAHRRATGAASGLRMTPARSRAYRADARSMAARWGGRQIVTAAWLDASVQGAATRINDLRRYGYHWYVGNLTLRGPRRAAAGALDRRLRVWRSAAVRAFPILSWWSSSRPATTIRGTRVSDDRVIAEFVLPSLQ